MNQPAIRTEREQNIGRFDDLAPYKYCQLTTFKRSGEPVPTPMWFAVDGERLYFKTEWPSGKVHRIQNDPRVELAPCTLRGRSLGRAVDGRARILATGEESLAERVLRSRYRLGRRLFGWIVEPIFRLRGHDPVYLEVVPAEGHA